MFCLWNLLDWTKYPISRKVSSLHYPKLASPANSKCNEKSLLIISSVQTRINNQETKPREFSKHRSGPRPVLLGLKRGIFCSYWETRSGRDGRRGRRRNCREGERCWKSSCRRVWLFISIQQSKRVATASILDLH